MLNETEFFATVIIKIFYMVYRDFIMLEIDGFRVLQQFLIPVLTGGIGGLSLMVMASLSNHGEFNVKKFCRVYVKLALLGGIAGVAAVNLLNPDGNISQVMILGLIAGLSGFSYLKRNSLVDSIHEDALLKAIMQPINDETDEFFEGTKNTMIKEIEEYLGQADIDERIVFESDEELNFDEVDNEKVNEYIDKKVREWLEENPDATEEEIVANYEKILAEVIKDPQLIDLEE